MPIPERRKALRAASKTFRGPSGIQHTAVLAAVKFKPSGRRWCAGLDRHCARQQPALCTAGAKECFSRTTECLGGLRFIAGRA